MSDKCYKVNQVKTAVISSKPMVIEPIMQLMNFLMGFVNEHFTFQSKSESSGFRLPEYDLQDLFIER